MSFLCTFCGKTFGRNSNLVKHVKKFHSDENAGVYSLRKSASLKCPECMPTFTAQTLLQLGEHIETSHNVIMCNTTHNLSSKQDFTKWKHSIEAESLSKFNQINQTTFMCNRSGVFTPTVSVQNRKRNIKMFGSKKIGSTCPAHIKVTEKSDGILVRYQATHFGHEAEPGILSLTKTEKDKIAHDLKQGISKERILQDAKISPGAEDVSKGSGSDTDDADESFRVHSRYELLSVKDISNIENRYGIRYRGSIRCHSDDTMSFTGWVSNELKNTSDGCVKFYKAQGELHNAYPALPEDEFVLIVQTREQKRMLLDFGWDRVCVDSTHGTNGYDFKLTTVLIVDEFNEGYPVGHCLSTREDAKVMRAFFEELKKECGVITCKTFMSDDAEQYRKAWVEIMGKPKYILLCVWHVRKAWKEQLQHHVEDAEKRAEAFKLLRACSDILEKSDFELAFKHLLSAWEEDKEMKSFLEYINVYYKPRKEMWAAAYRTECRLHVNMRLENFNLQLKKRFMNGKKTKRVDNCVDALLKLIEWKANDRKKTLNRGKSSHRSALILSSHQAGVKLKDDAVKYKVSINTGHLNCSIKCGLFCRDCCTCYYACTCTCFDYLIKGNMCKHVHWRMNKEHRSNELTRASVSSLPKKRSMDSTQLVEKINELCGAIQEKAANNATTSSLVGVKEHLEASLKLLDIGESIGPKALALTKEATNEPPNKKMKQQRRFFSVKKKPIPAVKPNFVSSATLQNSLLDVGKRVSDGSVHYEHNYTSKLV